jgi:uncharacterized HAD superfamily protein/hypoxanthine-guanine phosphoribosyltransferase
VNYRSVVNLSESIQKNLHKLPSDIDLIVGVPRSGMLAGCLMALYLNLNVCELDGYKRNELLQKGATRKTRHDWIKYPSDAKHVLIVDDSIDSGLSIKMVKEKLKGVTYGSKTTFCAIYSSTENHEGVNIYFELVKLPRVFEWNLMHRPALSQYCLDVDGVLCLDPSEHENDDGILYRKFLENAKPLMIPSFPVGHLVTSRLEKYRAETEQWLDRHNIEYRNLHMLDLPDAATRRRLACHAKFKSEVYKSLDEAQLFVESATSQAKEIARLAGKPVLSFEDQVIYRPKFNYIRVDKNLSSVGRRLVKMITS